MRGDKCQKQERKKENGKKTRPNAADGKSKCAAETGKAGAVFFLNKYKVGEEYSILVCHIMLAQENF